MCGGGASDEQKDNFIPRLKDVGGNSMWVKADMADRRGTFVANKKMWCLVVEAGVYNIPQHGVKMEAVSFQTVRCMHAALLQ